MSAEPNFPTLREELDRKAFQTLDWLFTSLDNGKLTAAQFSTGLDALFMATSGLVDDEIATLVTGAASMAKQGVFKRVFVRGANVIVLTRVASASSFLIIGYHGGEQRTERIEECDSSKEAAQLFERRVQQLLDKGFSEL